MASPSCLVPDAGPLCARRYSRSPLLESVYNVAIAPFGRIRFRDLYCGEWLTSVIKILVDVEYGVCFYVTGIFLDKPTRSNSCTALSSWVVPLICFIPLWARMMQELKLSHALDRCGAGSCRSFVVSVLTLPKW